MSIGVIFSIMVAIFLASSLLLMTTTAADLRKAATARRLKSLRSMPTVDTAEVSGDAQKRRAGGSAIPGFVPMGIRTRMIKTYAAMGHAADMRKLPFVALAGCALGFFVTGIMMRSSLPVVMLGTLVVGAFFPWQYLRMAKAGHALKFLRLFPDAIDLIVRAIRAGLPVSAAIDMVGREVADPVGTEFRSLTADIRVGHTFAEALTRSTERIQLVEFSFFAASLTLQNDTGGNLSETLETLGRVLRKREEMRLKVAAMTSEARTSAYVMGALPIVIGGLLFLIEPDYMGIYFTDPRGGYIAGLAAISMSIGGLVMRFMIKSVVG